MKYISLQDKFIEQQDYICDINHRYENNLPVR